MMLQAHGMAHGTKTCSKTAPAYTYCAAAICASQPPHLRSVLLHWGAGPGWHQPRDAMVHGPSHSIFPLICVCFALTWMKHTHRSVLQPLLLVVNGDYNLSPSFLLRCHIRYRWSRSLRRCDALSGTCKPCVFSQPFARAQHSEASPGTSAWCPEGAPCFSQVPMWYHRILHHCLERVHINRDSSF